MSKPQWLLLTLCIIAVPKVNALTVTLGASGCNFIGMQFAIDALAASSDTFHTVRMVAVTIPIPDGVNINVPANTINFVGGYATCSDSQPTAGLQTILDATGGNNGTALNINPGNRSTQQSITFENVIVRGGSSETGIGANPEGGGLEIRGHGRVTLRGDSRIEDNASGKGAGVYIKGASSSRIAELYIRENTVIEDNTALSWGGGVYCDDDGLVHLINGNISFNTADFGGGVFLNQGCAMDTSGSGVGLQPQISNNEATSDGGGIYLNADGQFPTALNLAGQTGTPFQFIGNIAGGNGGGLYAVNNAPTAVALRFTNTIWANQAAAQGAGMYLFFDFDLTVQATLGCVYNFFGRPGCSGFDNNIADSGAGAIETVGVRDAIIERTRFQGNVGAPAIIGPSQSTLTFENSIVVGNTAICCGGIVFANHTLFAMFGTDRVRYSTIVENTSNAVFDTQSGDLDATGTIVWQPGAEIWRQTTGSFVHNGCFLGHSAAELPGGVIVDDPRLEGDYTPDRSSQAIDVCDDASGTPPFDFYGALRGFEQTFIPDVLGANDLGAVERTELIIPLPEAVFQDSFESP